MGQKLFRIQESREGFLRNGVTVATLRVAGTEPVKRHLCVCNQCKKCRMYNVIRTKIRFNLSNDVFERL